MLLAAQTIALLRDLAERYETEEFLAGDPSCFMHRTEGDTDKELFAFIAAALSYGRRDQFLPRVEALHQAATAHHNVAAWLTERRYEELIPDDDRAFYRLNTNRDLRQFLSSLALIVEQYGTLKAYVSTQPHTDAASVMKSITDWFAANGSGGLVPRNLNSPCKRLCMYLRWMVRDNSPVDIGLWSDIVDRQTLLIPLDTHVLQQAQRLRLITTKTATMHTARALTDTLRQVFPHDPARADFALFGLGIANANHIAYK